MFTKAPFRIVLMGAVLLAAAAQGARAQKAEAPAPLRLEAPAKVAGFQLVDQRVEQGAGAELRYQQTGRPEWIDVYIYRPGGERGCQKTCDSIPANSEADDFTGMIPELLRRRYYDSLRVAGDERIEVEGGEPGWRGRHLTLRGARDGQVVTSQYYLLPLGSMMLKVRATFAPNAEMDSLVGVFTRGIVHQVMATTCAGGPPQSPGIEMSVELAQTVDELRSRVAAAFEKLGYEMLPAPAGATTWRSVPLAAWPSREAWSDFRATPNPRLQVWARAEPKGDKTELRIGVQATCGIPQNRQMESTTALMAAMEFTTEITPKP